MSYNQFDISEYINITEKAEGRYVGDLNLLTLSAFNCLLKDVSSQRLTSEQVDSFDALFTTFMTTDIPTAYIVGFELFLGLKVIVNEHTLIPRFETEELVLNIVERIKNKYPRGSRLSILDLCCGSGVIALSVYLNLKDNYQIKLFATDVSEKALAVAKRNFQEYAIPCRVLQGDLLKPVLKTEEKFDVIISNPPYIANDEVVQASVLKYEPLLALYASDHGLELYKQIIDDLPLVTKDKFALIFEIGTGQASQLDSYLQFRHGYHFEVINDINNLPRNLYLEV